jgi:maltooligosyltrehalose trehalohydrolase
MESAVQPVPSSIPGTLLNHRSMPVGAEPVAEGVSFRVWAPGSQRFGVRIFRKNQDAGEVHTLEPDGHGYFAGVVANARAGDYYRYVLERGEFPDPASRFQPDGPHGPSQVVAWRDFAWEDSRWNGVKAEGQVVYELHIGTFTKAGTWAGAMERLPDLVDLGVTVLEVMPVAEFPGRFGWGYDGVNLFAPTRLYGSPDDFRAFVNRAHALGLGVILDVVYNHFGPDGCYLREFSKDYFSSRYENEWGDPLNFDGPNCEAVREFFMENAAYWIREFHLDGLRLDATQQIFDSSDDYIVAAIARSARKAAGRRSVYLVGENEPQEAALVRAPKGGALDALWNDDFHHTAMVALTGQTEAYYTDYRGAAQEFVSSAKYGFLFQGQRYRWQKKTRGVSSLDLQPSHFVSFLQNHDQIANSVCGLRVHQVASPAQVRALTAWLLLGPATPMLFQGQEFAATAPFLYFADHHEELARMVMEGRKSFISQFPSAAIALRGGLQHAPHAEETFTASKLDWSERDQKGHLAMWDLHRDLLRLRHADPVIPHVRRGSFDGAVLTNEAFLLRYFSREHGDRLLLVNLGRREDWDPAPEPLLAPPEGCDWELRWSSEECRYEGCGTAELKWREQNWVLPAHAALFFVAKPLHDHVQQSHSQS